jgi:hypothetical protein
MSFWDWLWIAGLGAFVVLDVIADRTIGATFSEHVQDWFEQPSGKVVLLVFFAALFGHFAFRASVWPVVGAGAIVALYILRRYYVMRWDKWFEGAVFAAGVGSLGAIMAAVTDGQISAGEWYAIGISFVGSLVGWMKQHPPVIDTPITTVVGTPK